MLKSSRQRAVVSTFIGAALVFSDVAMAQGTPMLVVNFSGGMTALPLAPWVTWGLAALIPILAFVVLRRAAPNRFGTLRTFILIAAIIASVTAGIRSGDVLRDANAAVPPTAFPLVTSPASIIIAAVPSEFLLTNQTSGPILLQSIHVINANCVGWSTPPSTCKVGQSVQPGQSCILGLVLGFTPCPPS